MNYKAFSIKDKALDSYSAPFTQATLEAGLRMFREIVTFGDENNRYRRAPEDYVLYMVGEFDDTEAKMTDTVNVRIASAAEILIEDRGQENVT